LFLFHCTGDYSLVLTAILTVLEDSGIIFLGDIDKADTSLNYSLSLSLISIHDVEHFLTKRTLIPLSFSFCLLKYSMDPLKLFSASEMQGLSKRQLSPREQGQHM
jgi:hypothetical protein